jgi:hypothetical protein
MLLLHFPWQQPTAQVESLYLAGEAGGGWTLDPE